MWYYTSDGQQHGPLDDVALDQLITNGVVNNDTFVWKDGLSDWAPLGQVRAPKNTGTGTVVNSAAGLSTCTMCGKNVGADNLIDLLGTRVCAACKPLAVQTLREGATPATNNTAWRDGKRVVAYNQQSLPARCYKCNHPAEGPPLKRKLNWHPAGYYSLIVVGMVVHLGIIIYVIVAMIVRKRASVDVYLCSRHAQRRKYLIIGGWSGLVLGVAMLITGITAKMGILTALGFFVILLSIIARLIGASLARATLIKDGTIWMSGASKEFLASLPPWP